MNKIISMEEAVDMIKDGMTIMVGGFLATGSPEGIIDALVEKGTKDLTLICNDTAFVDKGVGKMVVNKQFKKIITSHIGTNPETIRQLNESEVELILFPQGTLIEKVRCGGAGIGGFYTPTGVGTEVEIGKEKKIIDGVEYILEVGIKADVSLIKGSTVDTEGNVFYNKTTRNTNAMMAMASDIVIVEAEKIVDVGEIDPHMVGSSAIFIDYIVGGVESE